MYNYTSVLPTDLNKRLKKCYKEIDIEIQPLYIDREEECYWCPAWNGSQLVKRVNQHCKRDKSHMKAHMKAMGHSISDTELQGVQDIRTFFT